MRATFARDSFTPDSDCCVWVDPLFTRYLGETLYQRAELRLIIGKADSEKPISWEDIWRERAWKKTDWRLVLSFSVGDLFDGPLTTFKASHSSNVIVHNCSPGNT